MFKHFLLLLLLLKTWSPLSAKKPLYIGIAVNNYISAKPFTGFPKLFYSQFHPGITLSTGITWKEKNKHQWMQTFKATYFSHRYIQRSLGLYTEFGYRYLPNKKIGLNAALGGGYLHMIPATEQFRQNSNGDWEEIKIKSRPQGLISLSLGIDFALNSKGYRGFMRYQNLFQTPFVPGYVPLLPYNVLHLGVTIPVSSLKKGAKSEA